MTAKEMFEELGYKLIKHNTYMFYYKNLKDDVCYEMDTYHIEFNFKNKSVNKSYGNDNTVAEINIQEFKAIQKQIEELGWLNETN